MAQNGGNMNIMEMVKLKVMMGMGGENAQNSIYVIIFMFIFSIIEKNIQVIINTIQSKINSRYNTIVSNLVEKTNDKYSIFLEKDLSKTEDNKDCYIESILHNISEKYNLKSVMFFKNLYVINFFERFNIEDEIYGKLHILEVDNESTITKLKIQISSDSLNVVELKKYIEKCYDIYKRKIQNNLGSDLYFFDQKSTKQQKFMDGSNSKIPFLEFEYNKFVTNRKFNNVFGENVDVLKKRVLFFKNNKKWYDEKGIPYTFGALLFGAPGTGKTSIIKAIANECNRHIININLANIQTNTQLKNLFYNKSLQCKDEFQNVTFDIGIDERLYVIEDIDCMSEVVLYRKMSTEIEDLDLDLDQISIDSEVEISCEECKKGHHEEHCYNKIKKHCPHCQKIVNEVSKCQTCKYNYKHCDKSGHCEAFLCKESDNPRRCNYCLKQYEEIKKLELIQTNNGTTNNVNNLALFNKETKKESTEEDNDKITLSSLLNILDGTLELPGRMIIITSNFPEKLDKALIRPGRIDLILELGKCSHYTIKQMYESFYNKNLSDTIVFDDLKWTPAEINCILFNNFDNPEKTIHDIQFNQPNSLSKF